MQSVSLVTTLIGLAALLPPEVQNYTVFSGGVSMAQRKRRERKR